MIKKVALPLIASLAFASSAQAAPGPNGPSGNVTYVPQVQLDLALAAAYWQVTEPTVPTTTCGPVQVVVQSMVDAATPSAAVAATDVGAETVLGSCQIDLSPTMWADSRGYGGVGKYIVCELIAHEYGHVLGLPDDNGNDMMNVNGNTQGRQDALCARIYTPHHLTRFERRWIAGNSN